LINSDSNALYFEDELILIENVNEVRLGKKETEKTVGAILGTILGAGGLFAIIYAFYSVGKALDDLVPDCIIVTPQGNPCP